MARKLTTMGRLVEITGFGNGKGELSFNKLVTFTALWVFAVALYRIITVLRMVPPWYVWSFGFGVVGAGFGLKGYLGNVARRTETAAQTDSLATTIAGEVKADLKDAITAIRGEP